LEVLKPFGRYAIAGAIGGPWVELEVLTLYLKDLSFYGCTVLGEGVFAGLVARIEAGQVDPLVAQELSLEQLPKAQELFEMKQHIGKFVVNLQL
jgi:NADPH:quinone reductase-like Zn-dependent oxidoreductase